jgi:hypothetical protein
MSLKKWAGKPSGPDVFVGNIRNRVVFTSLVSKGAKSLEFISAVTFTGTVSNTSSTDLVPSDMYNAL